MAELILVMMLLPLIGCFFVLTAPDNKNNAYNVAFFTLAANMVIILRMFALTDAAQPSEISGFSFSWLDGVGLDLYFGTDIFSLAAFNILPALATV